MARYPFKLLSASVPPLRVGVDNAVFLLLDPQRFISIPEAGLGQEARERGIFREFGEYFEQADVAITNMAQLLSSCRKRGIQVMYSVLGAQQPDWSDLSKQVRLTGLPIPTGAPGADIREEVAPAVNEVVLRRVTYGPFVGTDLLSQLRDQAIDTMLLAGLMANVSVTMAAREAADRGFNVVVIWDASASSTLAQHRHVKDSLPGGLIRTRSTREVICMLEGAGL